MKAEQARLPRNAEPTRYELRISVDHESASFDGDEQVTITVMEPVDEIVLNALDLEVKRADLLSEDGNVLAGEVHLDEADGRMTIRLSEQARPGQWTLRSSFSGKLNDKLRGFYRSTFSFENGAGSDKASTGTDKNATGVIATTQFEPTDARRAFPCWDEPDRKAVFSVSLEVGEGILAVSNTSVVEELDLGGGRRLVRFADTIPMSTYLVAFVAGPLEATEPLDVDGIALSLVHVPGKGRLTPFALDVAAHALRFFSEWFGIPYPGDKLDLIALPDFAFGAMENLGAVTFRESVLLIDPSSASRVELERVADVVSHELAHMWFGDLVTMKWWNGLWLNEAFATFMELLCVDDFKPAWDRWVSFGRSRGTAMATDGLSSTRPIEYPCARPEDAEGMFDVLTYEKGAGVLRMMERYLGTEEFRAGIRLYLDLHLYGNAETTDLWDAMENATGEPVRTTMDSWIFQGGHPLITVDLDESAQMVSLAQQAFRYRPQGRPAPTVDNIGSHWQVPVLVRASVSGQLEHHRVLMGPQGVRITLGGPAEWLVVNSGGWGFYRVRYPASMLRELGSDLGRLEPLERFNLVSDLWAAVLAGLSPLSDFILLARRLGDENDANVWAVVVSALGLLSRAIPEHDRSTLHAFVRNLLGAPFERVGWHPRAGESETAGTLRATLVDALGTIGDDPGVVDQASRHHARALEGAGVLERDLAGAIVSVVAAHGDEQDFEKFLERFLRPADPQEELRYLYGLAGFRDLRLLGRALEMSLGEVRAQNAPFLVQALLANRLGGPSAWSFVKDHWSQLLGRLPDNTVPRMLEGAAGLVSPDLSADVRSFCESHPLRSGQRTVEQMLDRLEISASFAKREGPGLARLLARP